MSALLPVWAVVPVKDTATAKQRDRALHDLLLFSLLGLAVMTIGSAGLGG